VAVPCPSHLQRLLVLLRALPLLRPELLSAGKRVEPKAMDVLLWVEGGGEGGEGKGGDQLMVADCQGHALSTTTCSVRTGHKLHAT